MFLKKNSGASSSTSSKVLQNVIVVDTSSLIDGRLAALADSGFLMAHFVIPNFVVSELQMLADGKDSQKRERARYGLDIIQRLQNSNYCKVQVTDKDYDNIKEVDDKLVALAKEIPAKLCTNDYNLNKVAQIQGLIVLNINELTQSLRTVSLPGEKKQVKILQKGSERQQGVGYLDDGTMIVVEDGAKHMRKTLTVEVTKMLQTEAGKMVFAEIVGKKVKSSPKSSTKPAHKRQTKPKSKRTQKR